MFQVLCAGSMGIIHGLGLFGFGVRISKVLRQTYGFGIQASWLPSATWMVMIPAQAAKCSRKRLDNLPNQSSKHRATWGQDENDARKHLHKQPDELLFKGS